MDNQVILRINELKKLREKIQAFNEAKEKNMSGSSIEIESLLEPKMEFNDEILDWSRK